MRMLAVTMISAATLAVGLHALGQSASETVDAHVAAAKAAAGQEHTGLFNAACAPTSIRPAPAAQRGQRAGGAAAARPGPPDRAQWHVEPGAARIWFTKRDDSLCAGCWMSISEKALKRDT